MTMRWLSGRRLSIAFFVSLAVNVLLVSAIAAYALRDRWSPGRDRLAYGIDRVVDKLPAEDGAKLRAAFTARAKELAALQATVRESREAMRRALRAEPFDAGALVQSMAVLDAKRSDMQRLLHAMTAEAAAGMTPDGRTRLAERPRRW